MIINTSMADGAIHHMIYSLNTSRADVRDTVALVRMEFVSLDTCGHAEGQAADA